MAVTKKKSARCFTRAIDVLGDFLGKEVVVCRVEVTRRCQFDKWIARFFQRVSQNNDEIGSLMEIGRADFEGALEEVAPTDHDQLQYKLLLPLAVEKSVEEVATGLLMRMIIDRAITGDTDSCMVALGVITRPASLENIIVTDF